MPVVLLNDGSNSIRLEVAAGPGATGVTWRPIAGLPFKIAGQSLCGKSPAPSFDLTSSGGLFTLDNIQFDPSPSCARIGLLAEPNGIMSGFFEYNIGTIAVKTAASEIDLSIAAGYYFPMVVVEAQMYRSLDAAAAIDANTQQMA